MSISARGLLMARQICVGLLLPILRCQGLRDAQNCYLQRKDFMRSSKRSLGLFVLSFLEMQSPQFIWRKKASRSFPLISWWSREQGVVVTADLYLERLSSAGDGGSILVIEVVLMMWLVEPSER